MSYQGHRNWATWNVILWIGNDEGLYSMARDAGSYDAFKAALRECSEGSAIAYETPDGAAWNDSGLDTDAIDEFFAESFGESDEAEVDEEDAEVATP